MRKEVIKTIIETIEEYNDSLDKNNQLPTDPDKSIYGAGSPLDSLGLVSFIIGLEQNIEDKWKLAGDTIKVVERILPLVFHYDYEKYKPYKEFLKKFSHKYNWINAE